LGTSVTNRLFYESGMGCVFGLTLDDGRDIVLKGQPPNLRLDRLEAAQRVQAHLADHGFPHRGRSCVRRRLRMAMPQQRNGASVVNTAIHTSQQFV
jgi:hypothetical protein